MKKILILFMGLYAGTAFSQLVARLELKENIEGICNSKEVYALFSGFKGQVNPVPPISKDEIKNKLQSEVSFIKDNPKFKGKLMIHCLMNCKGEMVQCTVDNKSGNDELDKQVLAVFATLKQWTPGTLDGKAVDTSELFSIQVKKGVISFN